MIDHAPPPPPLCTHPPPQDFCASGLRLGALHSRNDALNEALENLVYFSGVPGPTQAALATMLSDGPFLDHFFLTNERRLLEVRGGGGRKRKAPPPPPPPATLSSPLPSCPAML